MKNLRIINFLAFIILIVSISAMIGWFFDIPVLKAVKPYWDTMKFSTALVFSMVAIVIFTIPIYIKGNSPVSRLLLPVCSTIIFLIAIPFTMPFLFGIAPEQSQIIIKSTGDIIEPLYPGTPNYVSVIAFIIIASVGFLTVLEFDTFIKYMVSGLLVSFIGIIGILRYILHNPQFLESFNGMALQTAILILLSGISFILIYKYEQHNKEMLTY